RALHSSHQCGNCTPMRRKWHGRKSDRIRSNQDCHSVVPASIIDVLMDNPAKVGSKERKWKPLNRPFLFLIFFISGFCGLVYQVVWTRMAFASFGIIAPVLSIVISVFMLGISAGSWMGGRCVAPLMRKSGLSGAFFYACAELLIGLGAFAVPELFGLGE